MSNGMTIADFVQQVLYAMYRVRLEVDAGKYPNDAWHSKTDKFKEIVMEGNFMLQEFQKEQDWNFLRERWDMGFTRPGAAQEFIVPDGVYRVCTGYNDAVRLHCQHGGPVMQIPFDSPRSGNHEAIDMFDEHGFLNVDKNRQRAFVVGDTLAFYRPWGPGEQGMLETDVIRRIEPLHICDGDCPDNCPKAYEDVQFKWMPDPYYFVLKTAARRAIADPSLTEMQQSLTDEASKFLSGIRENDSAHNHLDTYETGALGYISVL